MLLANCQQCLEKGGKLYPESTLQQFPGGRGVDHLLPLFSTSFFSSAHPDGRGGRGQPLVDDSPVTLPGTVVSHLARDATVENAFEGGAVQVDNRLNID